MTFTYWFDKEFTVSYITVGPVIGIVLELPILKPTIPVYHIQIQAKLINAVPKHI